MPPRRQPKSWDDLVQPRLLPVTGHRDTVSKITYLPFSDVELGVMGWEVLPHLGQPFLVYIIPTLDMGVYEIRVHATLEDPDPSKDRLIGKVQIPDDLFTIP